MLTYITESICCPVWCITKKTCLTFVNITLSFSRMSTDAKKPVALTANRRKHQQKQIGRRGSIGEKTKYRNKCSESKM